MKALLIVVLTFLAVDALAQTDAVWMPAETLRLARDRADEYARALSLPSLSDGGQDEMRLWLSQTPLERSPHLLKTTGYVLTGEDAKVCRVDYPRKSTTPRGGVCKSYAPNVMRRWALADLPRLSTFAGLYVDCDISDAYSLLIEGVSGGKRFVLLANSPELCTGAAAKVVAEVRDKVVTIEFPH